MLEKFKTPKKPKFLPKGILRGAVDAEVVADLPVAEQDERTILPRGFYYAKPGSVTDGELARLYRAVRWPVTKRDVARSHEMDAESGISTIEVGVRDLVGRLVGYGDITYKDKQGVPGSFAVNPRNQNQGIGLAILDERLRLAEAAGIDSLYMPYLEETNTLRPYYFERGFTETPEGEIVRGPDPAPLLRMPPKI